MSLKIYKFDEFQLDAEKRRLFRKSEETVALTPRVFDVLLFLIERRGETVGRGELLDEVWGTETFVEDANLTQSVFVLRKALGDDGKPPKYILTVPHHGYRFIAEVSETGAENGNRFTVANLSSGKDRPTFSVFRYVAFSAVLIAAVVVLSSFLFWRGNSPHKAGEIKSIAVLPFRDLSKGQSDRYLSNGLSEAMTNRLSVFSTLSVCSTASVEKFAERPDDLSAIGRELEVEAVLLGSLERDGERLRVSLQLVRTADESVAWSGTFEGNATNFLLLQNQFSGRLGHAVNLAETRRNLPFR